MADKSGAHKSPPLGEGDYPGPAPSRESSARKTAAVLSSGSASARTFGLIADAASASRSVSARYTDFKLFHRVLRFWPKESFRKLMKASSGTCNLSICGAMVRRSTLECTLGGGLKAPGGSVN